MDTPGLFFTLLAFALTLGVLVFVHEWGHYYAARLLGVKAKVFSIGMGPEIWGRTDAHGTRWRLSALPLGGYVKFYGDLNAASQADPNADEYLTEEERAYAFHSKALWRRSLIIAAGPAINFVFAILIFALMFWALGKPYTPPVIPTVEQNSPAAMAGLQPGDRIVQAAGRRIDSFEALIQETAIRAGVPMDMLTERDGTTMSMRITPRTVTQIDRFGNEHRRGQLGIALPQDRQVRRFGPFQAMSAAVVQTGHTVRLMIEGLRQIILGIRSLDDLGGPVKIAKLSGEQAALGWISYFTFVAIISINLGLVNLFPIPVLDGGHLLFYAIEAVKGGPVSERVQEWGYTAGLAMVLGLMILLTFNDLMSL